MAVWVIAASTLALTLAGSLSGCASSTPPPQVTEQERNDATEALIACLVATDRKLDDNVSDASTVALALRPFCNAKFTRSFELGGRGLSPYGQELYDKGATEVFLRTATAVVIGERTKKRAT
jgi:hypothetical protein